MPIKVLVVDDSNFFCQQLTQILNNDADLKVIGIARNGREAIEKAIALKPDVITMDVEMPIMDGITATRQIMESNPTPILMLSSLTYEGAKLTLDALGSGAVDFLLKSYESLSATNTVGAQNLRDKVKLIASSRVSNNVSVSAPVVKTAVLSKPVQAKPIQAKSVKAKPAASMTSIVTPSNSTSSRQDYQILIIGASTGGPVAVQKILMALPANFPLPVVVVQHMPGTFTGAFANRLNGLCKVAVEEAADRAKLIAGKAYIAPGGKQIYFEKNAAGAVVRIRDEDPRVNYQPCVDISFASAAKTFAGKVLAFILTGMGCDGRDGARLLKQQGAKIWAQNQQSCVVYGMPMAVVNDNLADKILSLDDFSSELTREIRF